MATFKISEGIMNMLLVLFCFLVSSVWLQVSHEESPVAAVFRTSTGLAYAGWTISRSGCWSMLKGGIVVNASGPAELFFHSDNPRVEIWADSISLQPFSEYEWKLYQDQSIDKTRRRKVRFEVDPQGRPLANTNISIKQVNNDFPFGCAISRHILTNQDYQDWLGDMPRATTGGGSADEAKAPEENPHEQRTTEKRDHRLHERVGNNHRCCFFLIARFLNSDVLNLSETEVPFAASETEYI